MLMIVSYLVLQLRFLVTESIDIIMSVTLNIINDAVDSSINMAT